MLRKTIILFVVMAILLLSACSHTTAPEQVPTPTPEIIEIYDDPYVPFYTSDLSEVINSSQAVFLGTVEESLPAELSNNDDSEYVYTPVNIKVSQSLKGSYKTGDIFKLNKPGGVAEGVDFRPATMHFYAQGGKHIFFIDEYGNELYSESVVFDKLDGYFFEGKTVEEAISIIDECINGGVQND